MHAKGDRPRVLLMIFPCGSRMSVRHSKPSYPPVARIVGSSEVDDTPEAFIGGTRIHAMARTADWCIEI